MKNHPTTSFCAIRGAVLLQIQRRQVHFNHSAYNTTCLQPRGRFGQAWMEFQIADPQPAGRVCELQVSDLQAKRSCVSCLRVVCFRSKRNILVVVVVVVVIVFKYTLSNMGTQNHSLNKCGPRQF